MDEAENSGIGVFGALVVAGSILLVVVLLVGWLFVGSASVSGPPAAAGPALTSVPETSPAGTSTPGASTPSAAGEPAPGSRLYVGNLSWDTTEDSLRAAFSRDGRTVIEVTLVHDRETGRPRGFGFVQMANPADAQGAIESLDGTELDGRNITVNEARDRLPREGGGGGGGGGQGRDGERW